jgi:hypothetical protein
MFSSCRNWLTPLSRPSWPGRGVVVLLAIAAVLLVLWLLGFFVVHIAGAFIHILIVIAVVVVILHFVRGRRSTV